MFIVKDEQLEDKNNGYKAKIDERLDIFYNKDKFNELANDFIILTTIIPNINEFKNENDEAKNELIIDIIKNNRRKVIDEITRLLKISHKYIQTNYFNDLIKLLNIYHQMLYN